MFPVFGFGLIEIPVPFRYLGEALLSCLRSLHLDARGFDLIAREPDVAGSVAQVMQVL